MARGFKRKKGRYVAEFSPVERELVVDVLERTAALLARPQDVADGPLSPPDPATRPDRRDERVQADDVVDASGATDATDAPGDGSPGGGDGFEDMMRRAGFGGDAEPAGETEIPDDPAVRRLLPDGHRDDPEAAAAFRRLSARNVRGTKLDHLRAAVDALTSGEGTKVDLEEREAVALLRSLTDVRLVLAERLGLHSDDDVEHMEAQLSAIAAGDERAHAMLTYDFLTWLQETLASALLPR